MAREPVFQVFFFAAFAFLIYQLLLIATPYLSALLVASMLSLAFFPLHMRLSRVFREPNLAALLSTTCVLLAAVLPLAGLAWFVLRESGRLVPVAQAFLEGLKTLDPATLQERAPDFLKPAVASALSSLKAVEVDPRPVILENVRAFVSGVSSWGSTLARNILFTVFNGVLLVVALFFAFRDGDALARWFLYLIPMHAGHKQALARRARDTFLAVVIGVLSTAVAQALAALAGFWIAGVNLPALLAFATGMCSLLGASFLVTVPVALSVLRQDLARGIFLLVWGMLVVGMLDNVLKPLLIGSRARLPFILIFFSILGGLKAYGFLGFIIGPVLVAIFMTAVAIYREEYAS